MRILAISDSHGYDYKLKEILQRESAAADIIVHCGDGASSMLSMGEFTLGKQVVICRGNCDSAAHGFDDLALFEIGGIRGMATHGHLYQAKSTLINMVYAAKEKETELVLFGHTHEPRYEYYDGIWLVNPGCAADGEYARIDIRNGKIIPELKLL